IVYVADFEACPLTGQATRPECGEPPLVRQLRERVRLVHELAQLRRTEELLDDRRDSPRIDEVVDIDLVRIGDDRHALAYEACHPRQTDRELVRDQLPDR